MSFVTKFSDKLNALMEPNPVFQREIRARWRRMAAYIALFFYVAPLAIGMTLIYADKAPYSFQEYMDPASYIGMGPIGASPDRQSFSVRLAEIGRELFVAIMALQAAVWLLLAPANAAPALASERERGLLEALQLANLPPRRVVMGKLLSCLSFVALLLLVPIPIVAICFFFGGFSPLEAAHIEAIVVLTALHSTAIGLYCSSRNHRPAGALRDAFVIVVLWTGAAAFYDMQQETLFYFPMWVSRVFALANFSNPLGILADSLQSQGVSWPAMVLQPNLPPTPGASWVRGFDSIPADKMWLVNIGLQAASTLLLLFLAMRAAQKPLKEPLWIERERWTKKLRTRWKAAMQERPTNLKGRTQRALLGEFSIVAERSFNNPVFGRELRARTRLRGAPWWMWLLRVSILVYPVLIWIQTMADALEGMRQIEAWNRFAQIGFSCMVLYAAVTAAASFTRERENGTWEGLKLSLLTPGQILRGKVAPPVIVSALLALIIWPALLCCIRPNFEDWKFFDFSIPTGEKLTLWHLCAAAGIILGTAYFAVCVAILSSWLCRRTPVAIGVTLATLLAILLVPSAVLGIHDSNWEPRTDLLNARLVAPGNPVVALMSLTRPLPQLENIIMSVNVLYPAPQNGETPRQREAREATFMRAYEAALPAAQRQYAKDLARAQEELNENLALHRNLLWRSALCPLAMLSFGTTLLLILSALMRQKFRDEK